MPHGAGFYHSHCDSSLFICRLGSQVAYLLIYVDDIILIASSLALLQQIIDSLHNEFDMTDLGALNYFFGIFVDRNSTGLFLSQNKYALRFLERAHMVHCNPSRTPVDTESKLGLDGVTVQDPTLYRSLAGAKRQHTLSRSSAEAESRGVPNVVVETAWLRNLLHELHSPLSTATLVYCDNVSAVYMSANPVQHQRTKHIEIDIHFVRDMVIASQVRVFHVPSRYQYVGIFTKGLPSALFKEFWSSLSVHPLPAPTAKAWNECYDNEDELQSFRHKARQQDKVYDEREESCWILHLCTGIFYVKCHEGVMNEVPDGAAIFASSYWLRNSDMYRV
ncbi:ribonuclease H-like domain-containing protein [Tanacetum coccineum]